MRGLIRTSIYVASRASIPSRAAMWGAYRSSGYPIISSWIDEAGPGQTDDMSELWYRIGREIAQSKALVLYVGLDDLPIRGALVEVGMAIANDIPIHVACEYVMESSGRPLGSWVSHPLVKLHSNVDDAMKAAMGESDIELSLAEKEKQNSEAFQRTFDLRWKADMRAIKRWQAAHPGNDMVWPDRADMVVWLLDEMEKCVGEKKAAEERAKDAHSTLSAWFDLSTKMESEGTTVLRDAIETWIRRSENGGMPSNISDHARMVLDEAARTYLWRALVPVLRGMNNQEKTKDVSDE